MEETRSYTAESEPISLARFAERYRPCPGSPQAAVVVSGSGLQTSEQQVLAEGQVFIARDTKKIQVLQARLSSSLTVFIPITSNTLFAMLPDGDNELDKIVCKRWEKVFTSVADIVKCTPLPPALKVMADCVDHKKRHVAQGMHLYNVEVVEKRQGLHKRRGIRAVSSNGDPHTFLEGSTVRLSSQQSHTKSLPTYFDDVVQFPQRARVFLNSFEDSSLENLSELVFTGKGQEEYLVITSDLRGTGQEKGEASPSYSALVHVPLKAAIKVTAVSWKKPTLSGLLTVKRPLIKSPTASSPTDEIYLMEPIGQSGTSPSETTPDEEHEYQYIEATYDLPTPFHRPAYGSSGPDSREREFTEKHKLARDIPSEGPVYYNLCQTTLGAHSTQSRADAVHMLATPPHKLKGPPPAVKPKPVQHKRPSLGVMQHQTEVVQPEAMMSQEHPSGDVEYANVGSALATKSARRPTKVTFSGHEQQVNTTPSQSAVKRASSPWQPMSQHSVKTGSAPWQQTSQRSMKTASLPRQTTNQHSVNTTSPQTLARSKSLLATPLVVLAHNRK